MSGNRRIPPLVISREALERDEAPELATYIADQTRRALDAARIPVVEDQLNEGPLDYVARTRRIGTTLERDTDEAIALGIRDPMAVLDHHDKRQRERHLVATVEGTVTYHARAGVYAHHIDTDVLRVPSRCVLLLRVRVPAISLTQAAETTDEAVAHMDRQQLARHLERDATEAGIRLRRRWLALREELLATDPPDSIHLGQE